MKKNLLPVKIVITILILTLCSCSQKAITSTNTEGKMLALENFILIDGTGSQPVKDKVILINKDRILKVDDKEKVEIPDKCEKVNLMGCTLMPGFINTHVHNAYDEKQLQRWLASGVTTVRDLSARNFTDYVQKRDQYNKTPANAHLVSASPILKPPGGYGWITVDTPEAAKDTVNKLIDSNVDLIKFSLEDDLQGKKWPILSADMAKTIVDTAHARNKRTSVHISHARNLRTAIDAGVDEMSHMVVEKMDNNIISEIVSKNIYIIPTLELWQGVSKMHNIKWDKTAMENLSNFYKAGGKIAFGTDYEGYTCSFDKDFPITEVTLMQKAGMSNMDIIVSATKNAAFVCELDKELGTIEEGKKADILVVKGNPAEDISTLTKTKLVIHEGNIIVNKVQ